MPLNIFSYEVLFLLALLNFCQFGQCEVCCPNLGGECFDSTSPYLFQPNPECPTMDLEPLYSLYTRDFKGFPETFTHKTAKWSTLGKRSLYRFIVHGWQNTTTARLIELKDAFLVKEDANVILVGASGLMKHSWYPNSAANTRTLGAYMAMLFKKIKQEQKNSHIWCIGHSLGAHSCGHAGQREKIDRITGLDPASFLFQGISDNRIGISPDDADFVDIIHTSSIKGTFKRLGHADFYPNGGRVQPACGILDASCHHRMASRYFIQTLKNQCSALWKCSNIWFFNFSCTKSPGILMGYDAKTNVHGAFWAEVKKEEPYCSL